MVSCLAVILVFPLARSLVDLIFLSSFILGSHVYRYLGWQLVATVRHDVLLKIEQCSAAIVSEIEECSRKCVVCAARVFFFLFLFLRFSLARQVRHQQVRAGRAPARNAGDVHGVGAVHAARSACSRARAAGALFVCVSVVFACRLLTG